MTSINVTAVKEALKGSTRVSEVVQLTRKALNLVRREAESKKPDNPPAGILYDRLLEPAMMTIRPTLEFADHILAAFEADAEKDELEIAEIPTLGAPGMLEHERRQLCDLIVDAVAEAVKSTKSTFRV